MVRATFHTLTDSPTPASVTYAHRGGTEYELVVHVANPLAQTEDVPGSTKAPTAERERNEQSAALWHRRYAANLEPGKRTDLTARLSGGASPAAIGVVVYDVLEHFNFEVADIEELITSALARHNPDAPDATKDNGRSYRDRIRALVEAAVGSAGWTSLALEPSARRELSFTRVLRDGSVIDGALDLVALQGGAARILDVKTGGAKRDDALADQYRVQGAVYVDAVQSIAQTTATFALLSAGDGRSIDVDTSGVNVASLVEQLRDE